MQVSVAPLHCPCDAKHFSCLFKYQAPPEGEIKFQFSASEQYYREVLRCDLCGHFVSLHEMDDSALYSGEYVEANYRDLEGIRRTFERIISLPPSKSDNVGRVKRIIEFANTHFEMSEITRPLSLLDVGSGLGVFPYKMKEAGWDCTALDPDMRSVQHAREVVGVKAILCDFMLVEEIGQFDVITFNKVLEHVPDPVAMLAKSAKHLRDGGFVYVELPDGEEAMLDGPGREEFFIDHPHVFSATSLALLAKRAGFSVNLIERLREPSTKYTLRGFVTKN